MKENKVLLNEECQLALDEIFHNVAHQWRQPLSRINANVFSIDRMLKKLNINDAAIEKKLQEIESLTKHMSITLDDFKPKMEDEPQEPFYIEDILSELKEITIGNLKDIGVDLSLNIEENFLLDGYRGKLLQVLMVLIYNAKDILHERNVFPAMVTIYTMKNEEGFLLRVCDNGGGMSKNSMEKIFDSNYTTKHSSEGTGLGLNMLKRFIEEDFKGEISVHNFDKGTCFEIKFYRGRK